MSTLTSPGRKLIKPVTHKIRFTVFIPTLSLYHLLISVFSSKKGKFIIQNKEFTFWSKQGGFINPRTQQPAFEYGLTSGDKNSPSKITIFFKPFFGAGTKTKTGKVNNITKIGTDIEVNASYYERDDVLKLIQEFFKQIGGERFYDLIDIKEGKLLNLERHIRYNEEKEPDVREVFRIIKELSATRGDYDIRDTVNSGVTLFLKISAPTYDFMGFNFPYQIDIKSYRFDAYEDRIKEDALHHPKLEVFIGKSKEYPTLAEYETVKAQLDEFLLNLCHFAGLEDNDFVEDLYFKKQYQETNIPLQEWPPKEWKESFKNGQETTKTFPLENPRELELLLLTATSPNGCISKIKLQEQTKTP